MALNILGMEVLVVLMATQGDHSVSPQVIQPSEFFPYANSVPMVYLSSYLRFTFNPPAADNHGSTTPPPTHAAKLLEWLNPLLAAPLPPLTSLSDIFQNIRVVLCNGSLTTQQRSDLRDILYRYVNVRDLELFVNITIGADENPVFDAYDIAKYFYANNPLSSSNGLAAEDKIRLLVDLVLITNGTDACVGFLTADEIARLLFRDILPPRWDDDVKDEVVTAMVYLAKSNLTSQDITVIVDNFVKDSFLQNVPPYELIRFIVTFLSSDVRRPLCSMLHRYGALRCNNATVKDLGRLCVELDHSASTSEYYGVKVFSRLIAASLDCGNQTIPTTPSPTTPEPPPACGISDAATAGRSQRSADPRIRPLIIGGVNAGSCAVYPWLVRLDINGGSICGGAVLDDRHILTAAHCVYEKNSVRVTIGEYDINVKDDSEQYSWVDMYNGLFIHPDFDYDARKNDIAVLKLNSTIDLHRICAKPLCLDPTFQVQNGQKCQVAGWGITKDGDQYGSDILQTVSISTYQGSDCLTLFPSAVLSDPTKQLCAGEAEGKIDSCTGDSGGPLFCFDQTRYRWVAAGVVSYGDLNCARPGYPGVYGNVGAYYDWIQQKLIK